MRNQAVSLNGCFSSALVATLVVALVCGGRTNAQNPGAGTKPPAQTNPGDTATADPKPSQPKTQSLEEVLARALKDNPDIRVAVTKVREAEAELHRTRLQVVQKVVVLRQNLDTQKAGLEAAREKW